MELHNKYGADINVVTLIGSIRDIKRLDEVFETYHPSVVFHAAAHKHVPLMEVSPAEAVKKQRVRHQKPADQRGGAWGGALCAAFDR